MSTPWVEAKGAYSGVCDSSDDADVLQISSLGGAPVLNPVPDATWGLHLVDANIALGNAVPAKKQIKAYEKAARLGRSRAARVRGSATARAPVGGVGSGAGGAAHAGSSRVRAVRAKAPWAGVVIGAVLAHGDNARDARDRQLSPAATARVLPPQQVSRRKRYGRTCSSAAAVTDRRGGSGAGARREPQEKRERMSVRLSRNGIGVGVMDGSRGAVAPPTPGVLWGIALAGVAAAACAVVLRLTSDHGGPEPGLQAALLDWIVCSYIFSGLIAWWRRPESRFGPLMVAAGFMTSLSSLSSASSPLPFTIGQAADLLPFAVFLHVFLAFPTGRLEGRLERAWSVAALLRSPSACSCSA